MADSIRNWEPSSPALNRLSALLRSGRNAADVVRLPEWLPLLGGSGLGELLLGQSPEELERWSYGDLPLRVPEMSGVPVVKTGRKAPLADTLGLALDAGPLARVAARGASRGALRASDAATRAITGNPAATAMRVIEETRLPTPAAVIKPKGGNWLAENVERIVDPLKTSRAGHSGRTPEELLAEMRQTYTPEMMETISPETRAMVERSMSELEPQAALNSWLDKKLARYIRNEMATPEDPIRALAERGVSHLPEGTLPFPEYWVPDTVRQKRRAAGYPEEGLAWMRHKEAGLPEGRPDALARAASGWEALADKQLTRGTAEDYLKMIRDRGYDRMLQNNSWLSKVDPQSPVYGVSGVDEDLGFQHLTDELRNAINPESGLPPELLWKYSDLNKVSVPQAVERVAKINEWRAAQKALADAAKARNPATHVFKDYPEQGYSWVELRKPEGAEDVKSLEEALKYEGDTMGHCVGGYCPDVESGRSRIFSLRDKKGQPHVTIEVRPGKDKSGLLSDEDLPPSVREDLKRRNLLDPSYMWRMDETLGRYVPEVGPFEPSIVQIKGKANRAPNPEYLPAVQDFIRSQTWGRVGDLRNAGLVDLSSMSGVPDHLKSGPRFITQQEYDDAVRNYIEQTKGGEGFASGGLVSADYDPARVASLADDLSRELALV